MRVSSQISGINEHKLSFLVNLEKQVSMHQLDVVVCQLVSYEVACDIDVTQYHRCHNAF